MTSEATKRAGRKGLAAWEMLGFESLTRKERQLGGDIDKDRSLPALASSPFFMRGEAGSDE